VRSGGQKQDGSSPGGPAALRREQDVGVLITEATLTWLLQPSNPVVRAVTLEHVLGRDRRDPEVAEARGRIAHAAWVRRLMREQHPDGWWINPKNCYQPRGLATVWHLQLLAELGAPGDDPRIVRACDRFLQQNGMPDGGFACGVHRNRYSEECLTGHMLYTLVAFGRANEERVLAARDWVIDRQLADGGWNCRPNQSHSSFVSSLGAIKALAILPRKEHKAPLDRAIEFLLAHRLFFSHTTGKPIRKFWPAPIQFPAHYHHDLLHPLRALMLAGAAYDPLLDSALDALVAKADRRGRWRIDVAPTLQVETPGRHSKWATSWALAVLRHFGRVTIAA
jgi:hypothetical protein